MSEIPQWLYNIGVGISGLGVGGYTMYRKFKSDKTNDSTDSKTQILIDQLQLQLTQERERTTQLGQVIDRLSTERNDAVRAMGRLEGQLISMTREINMLKGEVQKQEELNSGLSKSVNDLREEIMDMAKKMGSKDEGAQ